MIIDGKEVNINYRQAQKVQERMNVAKDMPETVKTEVEKKEIKELNNSFNGGATDFSSLYGNQYGFTNNCNLFDNVEPGANRREYYDVFQEMSENNYIHRGLQIIADDACQRNIDGNLVKVYSDDEDIKNILETLFNGKLNLNKELWSIFYETCKLGDNFYEVIPDSYENPTQIARIRWLEPSKVNRIELNGKLAFYTYEGTSAADDSKNPYGISKEKNANSMLYKLQPWQIIHFKIADKDFYPYGGSLLKAGVRAYRRFSMLEDAITIYRLARVPERRIFKIDVGNLSRSEANRAINDIKNSYRTNQIVDDKGNIDASAVALSLTQDIFVPTRDGASGTEISTLQPGQALNNIDDIKFFRDEVLWTLNIPPEYLGSDNGMGMGSKGSLAMQDVKFARFVERIQYYIEEGLTKIASIELFFKRKKREDLKNFRIELTPPSNVKEIMDIEYLNQKMGLIQAMQATQLFPTDFILEYVMQMSKKEIADIKLYKDIEMQKMAGANGDMGIGGMDMGMPMGGGMDMGMPMGGDANSAPMPTAPMPAASVTTEDAYEKMINLFGKDFLIENKEDYAKLMKAAEDYEKQKKIISDKSKDMEKISISENDLLTKVKNMIISEKKPNVNTTTTSLISENELGGLNFKNSELKYYSKPKKRSGPKSKNASDIVITENVVKLNSKKGKILNE